MSWGINSFSQEFENEDKVRKAVVSYHRWVVKRIASICRSSAHTED